MVQKSLITLILLVGSIILKKRRRWAWPLLAPFLFEISLRLKSLKYELFDWDEIVK